MRNWRTWTILIVVVFIAFNVYYWKAYVCSNQAFCHVEEVSTDPRYKKYVINIPFFKDWIYIKG